ncbi:haloacid dehalogenase [Macrolepiota fuliginosa MF-IS2]|uniref:Haloacid dehalogenase n=1 Tax=Macrolepiota fuliginosa MF-IS2 TaxID=1400762 RepID=A0A9P5X921_9AGAR|nr:haloacid dehalogenase [Macrolepiota fuliginosa MF-IS2]
MAAPGQPKLTDFKVLVFDVYGTLCDWESGIFNGLRPLLEGYPESQKWDRKDVLAAYAAVEHDLEAQFPDMLYSNLLAKISEVLEERLKAQSGNDSASTLDGSAATSTDSASISAAEPSTSTTKSPTLNPHVAFGQSVQHWPIFPDSSAALHELAKDYKLIVLSNVDRDSFRYTHAKLSLGTTASNAQELEIYNKPSSPLTTSTSSTADQQQKLIYPQHWHPQETPNSRSPFSLIVTAQDVKCYKPALGGFHAVLECIRADPALLGNLELSADEVKEKVLIVAQSLEHDHEPAHRLGLTSVWIDRQEAVTCKNVPEGTKRWTWKFETLGEMAEAVSREKAT